MSPPSRRSLEDLLASVRRSVVGIRSPSSRGTGWVALGNDLVVTSQSAVGFDVDVTLELDGGARHAGRVVWADVPRDLAVVLPSAPLGLPPLALRPDLPRLGESALVLAATPGEPFRFARSIVSAVDARVGASRCFELDAPPLAPGNPVVDLDGHILGLSGLDLPRGSAPRARAVALPVAALHRALLVFDVPAAQLASHAPTYRCPSCSEPFPGDALRCGACGRALPAPWTAGLPFEAVHTLRALFGNLASVHAAPRLGSRLPFHLGSGLEPGPSLAPGWVAFDASTVLVALPVAAVPTANQRPFYRFLLTLNDQLGHGFRALLDGDEVCVALALTAPPATPAEGERLLRELVALALHHRSALEEAFGARPLAPTP